MTSANPFESLFRSRKFWLLVLDVLVSTVLYFTGKYLNASTFEDIKVLVGALQLVFVTAIGAIAYEDGKQMQAGLRQIVVQMPKDATPK